MRPAAATQDNTPVWVFDRLLGMEVPASVLVQHILPAVAASADDLPDATAAKLRLRLLDEDIFQGRMDETTLSYLQELDSCRVGPLADEAVVCPPPDLLLKVGHCGDGWCFAALVPATLLVCPTPHIGLVPGLHPASYEPLAAPTRPASQPEHLRAACPRPQHRALCRLPSPPRCAAALATAGQD